MGIEIKNANVVIKLVEEKIKAKEREFEQAVSDLTTEIVVRTRQGKDVDGKQFADYTPKYGKFRQKRGRNVSPVDLTFKGQMLAAIQSKVEKIAGGLRGTIFFNSAREALKAQGNQQKRRFFGLSDEQVKRLVQRIKGA